MRERDEALAARAAYAAQLEARLLAQHKALQAAARAAGARGAPAPPRPRQAAVSKAGAGPARAAGVPLRDRSNQPCAAAVPVRAAARAVMPAEQPPEQPRAAGATAAPALREADAPAAPAASTAAQVPAWTAPARGAAAGAPAAAWPLPGDRLAGRAANASGGASMAIALGPRAVTELAEEFLARLRTEGPPESVPSNPARDPSTRRPDSASISGHAGNVRADAGVVRLRSGAGGHERPAADDCQPDMAVAGPEGRQGQASLSPRASVACGKDATSLAERNRHAAAAAPTYVSRRSMRASAMQSDAGRRGSMRPGIEPIASHVPPEPHGSPASDSSPALSELVYDLGGSGFGAGLPEAGSGPPSIASGSESHREPGARRSYSTQRSGSAVASPRWLGEDYSTGLPGPPVAEGSRAVREGSWDAGPDDPQRMGDLSLDQLEARIAALGRTLAPTRGLVHSSAPGGALRQVASDPDMVQGPAEPGLPADEAMPSAQWCSSASGGAGAAASAHAPRGSAGAPAGAQQEQAPARRPWHSGEGSRAGSDLRRGEPEGPDDRGSLRAPSASGAADSQDVLSDLGSAVRAWARSPTPRVGGGQGSWEGFGGASLGEDSLLRWAAACPSGAPAAAPGQWAMSGHAPQPYVQAPCI